MKRTLPTQPALYNILTSKTGTNTARYLHTPQGVASQQNPDTSWHHFTHDGLGSVRQVLDESLDPVATTDFAPYGEPFQTSGTNPTNFGFTGEWTAPNGWMHLRARDYAPELGVFPSLDPRLPDSIENALDLNPYAYAQNNPANMVDPSGMTGEKPSLSCGVNQGSRCDQPSNFGLPIENDGNPTVNVERLFGLFNPIVFTRECGDNAFWRNYYFTVLQGLSDINQKLRIEYGSSIQEGLTRNGNSKIEFRLVKSGVSGAALTQNPSLIKWNPSGLQASLAAGDLRHGVVHEFGHVLEQLNALKSIVEVSTSRWLWLPPRNKVANMRPLGGIAGTDATKEVIADYFMFWVYDAFKSDILADVAQAFLLGNQIVVWHWYRGVTNESAYRVVSGVSDVQNAIESFDFLVSTCNFDYSNLASLSSTNPVIFNENATPHSDCVVVVAQTEGLGAWLRR